MEHDAIKVNVRNFIYSLVSRKIKDYIPVKTVIWYCVHFWRKNAVFDGTDLIYNN